MCALAAMLIGGCAPEDEQQGAFATAAAAPAAAAKGPPVRDSGTVPMPRTPVDYYVDPSGSDRNAGTDVAPFATFQYAMRVALAGDRVLVRAGTYAGGGVIVTAGTASAPVQMLSIDGPRRAIIEGGNEALRVGAGAAYLVFDGFEVRNSGDNAVHLDGGAHHIWLRNLYAHDAGPDGDVAKVNQCHHIYIEGCEFARPGRRLSGVNPYQECLDLLDVDDAVIRDSFLHDGGSALLTVKGGSRNAVIERNVIADQRAGASDPAVGLGGVTDKKLLGGERYEIINVIFRNNIVQNTSTGAIGIYDGQGVYLADNLLVNNDGVLVEFRAGSGPDKRSATVRIFGHLFVDTRGRMPEPYRRASDGLTDFTTSNNLFWNAGAPLPSSSLINLAVQPGHLVADPGVVSASGDRATRIAAMMPSPIGPAAGTGLDLRGTPFFVLDDINAVSRGSARDRGPYLLTGRTAPALGTGPESPL